MPSSGASQINEGHPCTPSRNRLSRGRLDEQEEVLRDIHNLRVELNEHAQANKELTCRAEKASEELEVSPRRSSPAM